MLKNVFTSNSKYFFPPVRSKLCFNIGMLRRFWENYENAHIKYFFASQISDNLKRSACSSHCQASTKKNTYRNVGQWHENVNATVDSWIVFCFIQIRCLFHSNLHMMITTLLCLSCGQWKQSVINKNNFQNTWNQRDKLS